jgi:hypothetical protein
MASSRSIRRCFVTLGYGMHGVYSKNLKGVGGRGEGKKKAQETRRSGELP